jgi:hypothetical protein
MTTAGKIGGLLALSLCLSGGSRAQTDTADADRSDIRIVSSFVAPGQPVPEDCRTEAHIFAESLVRYPRPASWHLVLVCDEAGWRRFLRLSGRQESATIYASTDLTSRTTYLRGAKFLNSGDFGARPEDMVAHELAHIRLQNSDEAAAAALARRWQQLRLPAGVPGGVEAAGTDNPGMDRLGN